MTQDTEDASQTTTLTPEELESALALLREAEGKRRARWPDLFTTILSYLAACIGLLALISGILVIAFDSTLGKQLLLIALLSLVPAIVLEILRPDSNLVDRIQTIQKDLQPAGISQMAGNFWSQHEERRLAVNLLYLVSMVALLAGAMWLAVALISGDASLLQVVPMVVGVALLAVLTGTSTYQEYQYYEHLAGIRHNLEESHKQASEVGDDRIGVSHENYQFLSNLEAAQKVKMVAQELPETLIKSAASYAVAFTPDSRRFLAAVPPEDDHGREAVRDAIDSLQNSPRLASAKPVSGEKDLYELVESGYTIVYHVDDERQRVDVVAIRGSGGGDG